jgi:glutamate 5-kinase
MTERLVVVKIGTSSITTAEGKLDEKEMSNLATQISQIVRRGTKVVLVTSGAVAAGASELGMPSRPNDLVFQQACAATGQSVLMSRYREHFRPHQLRVAQILLTAEDLSNKASYIHTRNVLKRLLKLGVVPIINENDVTSVDELKPFGAGFRVNFSDNDILSVLVANSIRADMLIILSDVDGLYSTNPKKPGVVPIRTIERITPELKRGLSGKGRTGRGGIRSKIEAAEIAGASGIPLVIANSRKDNVIIDVLAGRKVGTYFKPQGKMTALKKWIAYGASVKGQIFVNDYGKGGILDGSGLLPMGVTKIVGHFNVGEVVGIIDSNNVEFAKGNPNYNNGELAMIMEMGEAEVKKKLGPNRPKEVIWRENLHLTEDEIC